MRKRTINSGSEAVSHAGDEWLDLERLAQVEITSESAEQPIESALIPDREPGWRAAQPGKQAIRVIFDQPVSIRRILLRFDEKKQAAPRNLCCAGYRKANNRPERSCVSSIPSVRPPLTRRSRITVLSSTE
jgi:hypothetical protein